MKKKYKVFLCMLIVTLMLTSCISENKILMKVNDETVTDKDFQDYIKPYRKEVLAKMSEMMLINQKAKEYGITVTEEEVNMEVENYKNYFDTEKDFIDMLDESDSSLEQMKFNIEQQLTLDKLILKISEEIEVTDEEMEEYFENQKEKLSFYDVTLLVMDDDTTEEQLKEIYDKINEGEDFEKIIEEYGNESSGKQEGIQLYDYDISEEVLNIEEGEIYPKALKNYMGTLIVRLDKKVNEYDQLKETIRLRVRQEKGYQEYSRIMAEFQEESHIEIF